VYSGKKEVQYKVKSVQGVIESSLWNTMKANGHSPMLTLNLENVYAWTIDFFSLQKGDRFRLIYDEIYVDSVSIGINKIYAAQFDYYGKEIYAFRFEKNDSVGFYNEKGENLQKEFLKAPLAFSRISSHFSGGRMHPILRIVRPHHGVDYSAPKGTPVMSIGEGTVISKGWAGGGGNTVKIRHNSVYTTQYMHLSGYADGISQGARVRQGQVIGYVGSTGLSTGPHLDFRVYMGGSAVNPLTIESPPAKPVDPKYMSEYTTLKDSLMKDLKKIAWL
jgi:murein DD-endopeptidase MepM/ murein hydrolase activator NlpD